MKADTLRAVRVITSAFIKQQEYCSKEDVLEFVDELTLKLNDDRPDLGIRRVKGIRILYDDEELKK